MSPLPVILDPDDPLSMKKSEYDLALLGGINESCKFNTKKGCIDKGLSFVKTLKSHDGWWSPYINSPDPNVVVEKLLLTLAFTVEFSSELTGNSDYDDMNNKLTYMKEAVVNKVGIFMQDYGTAGYYAFIGGRQSLTQRDLPANSKTWNKSYNEYLNNWGFGEGGSNYLPKYSKIYPEAKNAIELSWSKIINYDEKRPEVFNKLLGPAMDWGNDPPLAPHTGSAILYQENIITYQDGVLVPGIFYILGK